MVMVVEATYASGIGAANALRMSATQWQELQRTYRVGDLLMPCCNAPAIPKVSANGHPFFAHLGDACSTSEESQWHLAAKAHVRSAFEDLGCKASVEVSGSGNAGRWQADVWGERDGVKLAVEIQRSYQSLRDYRKRQQRYQSEGVKALWLLRTDRYETLTTSMGKERLRTEFGGKFPPSGHFGPCVSDLPVAILELNPAPAVRGAGFFAATLPSLIEAVLSQRFLCIDGLWCIDNLDSMNRAAQRTREAAAAKCIASKT
ncbi:competence protein CoiA [Achromobacter xylosoxidans]|uniref:Competence protein CoiA family protein n=1 Tax=Alcaligenes xylosoxydans xylosoxydans TaxID=85698 RepID=A0A9X3R711_ALCXX|nr:competence protein CoiA family protein [Achromobacter xylosoxidans]MCZ8405377.1 competence protein CoiA family protein [Achromobacter xylosoxidans]